MSNINKLKSGIKTVKNISKVTKTMEMISSSRIKKSLIKYQSSLTYNKELNKIISDLSPYYGYRSSYTYVNPNPKSIGLIVVGPTKGFASIMLTKLIDCINKNVAELIRSNSDLGFQGIGINKVSSKVLDSCGIPNKYFFNQKSDSFISLSPIFYLVKEAFLKKEFDALYLSYISFTNFYNQEAVFKRLLPIDLSELRAKSYKKAMLMEPSITETIDELIKDYIEKNIYNAVLSSALSEHVIRTNTMKTATQNANNINSFLVRQYNKTRQALITSQVQEVLTYD